jgi:hypothetical protein
MEDRSWIDCRGRVCRQQRSKKDASFTRGCVLLFFSLLQWQTVLISFLFAWWGKMALYIVKAASRQPSVDCTPFYRQHLCRGQCTQEQRGAQQHTWNSKPFVIFPAEITAAQSLHFQHLIWTEVVNSRRL